MLAQLHGGLSHRARVQVGFGAHEVDGGEPRDPVAAHGGRSAAGTHLLSAGLNHLIVAGERSLVPRERRKDVAERRQDRRQRLPGGWQ